MLEIVCGECGRHFHVEGYPTLDGETEPGEVVTDLELCDDSEELCECLLSGEAFVVVDEEYDTFPDDVI